MEAHNNVSFGNTHFDQLGGNIIFGTVVLEPDFTVFDVQVQNTAVNAPIVLPVDLHKLVVVSYGIGNHLGFNSFVSRAKLSVPSSRNPFGSK